ncbi:galactose mutarotase [Chryseobacterium phosphatilyticum]|uniref:Galactose mutarotase n=1 Tax=Chryseobacterium phosphatilyticum TaxID=475075 RepID=A0A316WLL3_9FLAO|nr:aldose epimerase family protein [Chryseobacterium phosphatilyticum]PWN61979.1 galactose mutarotase [Chryseobacterium phosphatilyticum]
MSHLFLGKLINRKGFEVSFCNFGATITSFKVPISDGDQIDIVLGFDHVDDYKKSFELESRPFLGAVVGPHAGRVKSGKYMDDEIEIQLEQNCGEHHLHGGSLNLSNQYWEVVVKSDNRLVFEIVLNNGKTKYTAEYFLNDDTLFANLRAETKVNTLINLTQHSYFNLDGHQGIVSDLKMKLEAEKFLEKDSALLPTGKLVKTQSSDFDFSEFRRCPSQIDTSFVLTAKNPGAILKNEKNGLMLKVYTNQPIIHVYVGGHTHPIIGKENTVYHTTSGICFEAQNFPDSPNHANFTNGILRAGEKYTNEIAYKLELGSI